MSIKIIKNTMTEPTEVECPHCKSVLSYTYNDIQRRTTYNFLGLETGTFKYIVCPVCKEDIDRSPKVRLLPESSEEKKEGSANT